MNDILIAVPAWEPGRLGLTRRNRSMPKSTHHRSSGDIGMLVRQWRDLRKRSQLDVSMSAGISQRHFSFIEIGRSLPSREVVISIAETLEIPYRDRNALLLAAGYAPLYEESGWDAEELKHVTRALTRVLKQQEPYPAMVLDRYWNVVMTNASTPRLFGRFVDLEARPKPRNLLHLLFDPNGLRPFVVDWEALACTLIQRVYREIAGRVLDRKSHELLDALLAYPGTRPEWRTPVVSRGSADLPVLPIRLNWNGKTLSYFSMLTTLATPQTMTTQELRIESMFPLDEITEALHARLMDSMAQ